MIAIAGLYTYPVKSCRGIEHAAARLTEAGLEHDREWMFVTPGGRFLTQREEPRLARIEVAITGDALTLAADGAGRLSVPLEAAGARVEVTVWRDRVPAVDQGDAAADWAGSLLGREARLVRFDRDARRPSDRAWTGETEALNRFSDGFPLLVISRASFDDLNARLSVPLPMNRFRPSIVLDGVPPYGEDGLRELRSEGVVLRVVKPCARCVITTTDQDAGVVVGEEPLRTLKAYRWDAALRGATFGQNAIVVGGIGRRLRVGMQLEATPQSAA
ncbi:MAG: MOSC domain-containing protein [Gammaproteobacteria bacterium]|nr:MOSC domain-containing protein [Gammaproteobacteria bacterium]